MGTLLFGIQSKPSDTETKPKDVVASPSAHSESWAGMHAPSEIFVELDLALRDAYGDCTVREREREEERRKSECEGGK